jgi:hypothetical protein
MSIYYLKYHI